MLLDRALGTSTATWTFQVKSVFKLRRIVTESESDFFLITLGLQSGSMSAELQATAVGVEETVLRLGQILPITFEQQSGAALFRIPAATESIITCVSA